MMLPLMKVLVGVGMAIFALAWVSWFFVGGSAAYEVAGHFYVDHKGRLVEVTKDAYTYSLWLGRAVMVTFPLAVLAGCILSRQSQKQRQKRIQAALRGTDISN